MQQEEGKPLHELFNMVLPEAVISELSTEPFDDCIGAHSAELAVQISDLAAESEKLCLGYGLHGENPWAKDLGKDATVDDMLAVAEASIFKLAGRTLKTLTEKYAEVRRTAYTFTSPRCLCKSKYKMRASQPIDSIDSNRVHVESEYRFDIL